MKIKIQKAKFLDALKKVQSAANAKTTMPILANVKIEAKEGIIALTTTNLDLTQYTEVDCDVAEIGAITVPMKMLFSIVCAMVDGEVEMELCKEKMRIKCGNYVTHVGTKAVDEFPVIENADAEMTFNMTKKHLRDLLRKTSYAMSADDTRKIFKGTLFEFSNKGIRCVAADGKRLAVAENDGEYGCTEQMQYIVPALAIQSILKFVEGDGDVVIEATKNQMRFFADGGADKIITRLVDGVYPNYMQVVPNNAEKIAKVDRQDLIGAVERVSVMATRTDLSIKMTFADNRLLVEVKGDDFCDAHDEIPVKYDGEKVEIIFNPKYVADVLRASDADEMEFAMSDGLHAAIIRNKEERMLCTLMPLRVSNV